MNISDQTRLTNAFHESEMQVKNLRWENQMLNKRLSKVVAAFEEAIEELAQRQSIYNQRSVTENKHDWFEKAGLLDEDF
jgi:hypothetical protein